MMAVIILLTILVQDSEAYLNPTMIKSYLVVFLTNSVISVGFKYYLVIFLTVSLISVGILLLKNPLFLFANASAGFLNSVLESKKNKSSRQKSLLNSFGNLLPKFGLLIFFIVITIGVSFIPVAVYLEYNPESSLKELDMHSIYFFISVILGSVALFIVPWANRNRDSDYFTWSMLFHRMILEHYNISSALFRLEKRLFKKKAQTPEQDFVIVTGLARGGTTALTDLLYESNRFHSLSYDNMPLLLAPNLWRKLHCSRNNKSRQEAPDYNLMYGYKTVGFLEEYFFKVFLKDSFISGNTLEEHEVDKRTYEDYLTYQKLIRQKNKESIYLAKNNNLILRYRSLRTYNPDFKIVLIFRDPLGHAYSLKTQHNRFCDMHEADPFSLEYMNWLGHHEFGLNHKVFHLELMDMCKHYDDSSISYWIAIWISYYTHILSLTKDENLYLVDYADLCARPKELLSTLGDLLKIDLSEVQKDPYTQTNLTDPDPDPWIMEKAQSLYQDLLKYKLKIK